jgi:threonylcarbamoyladenosine tRNA methylthiotransferase MtaB
VIANARTIAGEGIREIVLTGVNIGDFRDPQSEKRESRQQGRLIHLLDELEKINSVERFRISSIEPNLCSNEIIDMVAASHKFMPHFHMPLQSGNDHILRLMRRRYTRDLYQDRVAYIRSRLPDACVGADVIVGFPGESDKDFDVTKGFLTDLDINYLHIFTYSERSNTPAADMSDSVPMVLRRERNEQLRQLSDQKQRQFYQDNMHSWRTVLLEKSKKSGFLTGFTDNYIKIEIPKTPGLEVNQVCPLYLDKLKEAGLVRATSDDQILTSAR